MAFYFNRDYAIFRQRSLDKKGLTAAGMALHWVLVFYHVRGIMHVEAGNITLLLFLFILSLATWCWVMAAITDPGHIDYERQDKYSCDKLNKRLYEVLVEGAELKHQVDIQNEHTETELID
jgi:hypothetical protein